MIKLLIVSPLVVVLLLAVIGHWSGRWNMATAQPVQVCGDHALQEKIRGLMHQAVEDAFVQHIESLHSVWMRDDHEQPQRAATGVHKGVAAYMHGRKAVETWSLKPC